jgi:hypothetical protein
MLTESVRLHKLQQRNERYFLIAGMREEGFSESEDMVWTYTNEGNNTRKSSWNKLQIEFNLINITKVNANDTTIKGKLLFHIRLWDGTVSYHIILRQFHLSIIHKQLLCNGSNPF